MFAYYEGGAALRARGARARRRPRRCSTLYNDQAAELLGLPPRASPRRLGRRARLPPRLCKCSAAERAARRRRRGARDPRPRARRRTISRPWPPEAQRGSRPPPVHSGRSRPCATTPSCMRVTGELETMRTLSDALRSQTHEFSNRLHTIVVADRAGPRRRGPPLRRRRARPRPAARRPGRGRRSTSPRSPPCCSARRRRRASARRSTSRRRRARHSGRSSRPGDLVTILGNLVDNALDAAAIRNRPRHRAAGRGYLGLGEGGDELVVEVSDSGPGIDYEARERVFGRGFSTKESDAFGRGIGLALVRQTVARLGGASS